jgi:hypothetical protein
MREQAYLAQLQQELHRRTLKREDLDRLPPRAELRLRWVGPRSLWHMRLSRLRLYLCRGRPFVHVNHSGMDSDHSVKGSE